MVYWDGNLILLFKCWELYCSSEVACNDQKYLLDPCIFGKMIGFSIWRDSPDFIERIVVNVFIVGQMLS